MGSSSSGSLSRSLSSASYSSYLPSSTGPLIRSSSSSRSNTPPQHSITLAASPTHISSSSSSSSTSSSNNNAMPTSSSSSALSSLRQRNPYPDPTPSTNLSARQQLSAYKNELKQQRKHIRLFTSPIVTLTLFTSIVLDYLSTTIAYLLSHRTFTYFVVGGGTTLLLLWLTPGAHQAHLKGVWSGLSFSLLWLMLGVLSSVGLGTGLHTFVLYLGPYIAKATLAATECGTLDVPLSGPQAFMCPVSTAHSTAHQVTFVGLLLKVAPAALLWGAGTAVGELPPYFVSRAATLSGQKLAELDKLTELDEHSNTPAPSPTASSASSSSSSSSTLSSHQPSLQERIKLFIYHALEHYGFWAILLLASIPNPLFDLAGLACGHFLIPFATFFSATVLGKAVIKAQIQTAVVIAAFRKESVEYIIHTVESRIRPLQGKLAAFFQQQREQFHTTATTTTTTTSGGVNWFGMLWNLFLFVMIGWFVVSIVDSSVQERLVTRDQVRIEKFAQEKGIEMKTDKDDQ